MSKTTITAHDDRHVTIKFTTLGTLAADPTDYAVINVYKANGPRQDAYFKADAFASYELNDKATLRLNVNNLFDKKYYDNVGFYNGVYWGDPRTVTVSLDWKL